MNFFEFDEENFTEMNLPWLCILVLPPLRTFKEETLREGFLLLEQLTWGGTKVHNHGA